MSMLNKKIGIVMTYYNRQYQLNKTLETIKQQVHNDISVVVVDDRSDNEIVLPDCDFEIKVIRIGDEKQWNNPEPAYNRGILHIIENTDSEIIILQNAECYHVGNVLEHALVNTNTGNYITYGCYSIDEANTFNPSFDALSFIKASGNDRTVVRDKTNGWYNHPVHRPVAYEFCSAMHRSNMLKLNGYDERFSLGLGYGDTFLLHRINLLKLNVVITASPIVVHQWHDDSYTSGDLFALRDRNSKLLKSLRNEKRVRAVHQFTKDLC